MISIESIEVENLRGYGYTYLELRKLTVLVGENNEGKSSLLKMLEKFLSIDASYWGGDLILDAENYEFWYPANNALHKARRFSTYLKINDGRVARRFGATKKEAFPLRFAIHSDGRCRLNIGPPKRGETHDPVAVELLELLRKYNQVVLLPPVRDAKNSTFSEKVTHAVKKRLRETLGHNKQAGAPKEYRLAKNAIKSIKEIVARQSGELSRSEDSPLASMLTASEVRVELFPSDIVELIEKSIHVYLSTGKHDELKVLPGEVGNGLQSLIDINFEVEKILKGNADKNTILIIEEPEAFLHPAAQRQFMQYLRRALVEKVKAALLTTHSPIIIDEANYEEIVLVRNQKHYPPSEVEEDRASINTSLMTSGSAEIFFCSFSGVSGGGR